MPKKVELHEVAKRFPPMPHKELVALREDIKANGQHVPCLTFKGKIIDGTHRKKACDDLKIAVKTEPWRGEEADLLPFIISQNIMRRHLTGSQRAMWAASVLLPLEKKREPERIRRHKAALKREAEKRAETAPGAPSAKGDDEGPISAAAIVADQVGVGARYIYKALAIRESSKPLAKQVMAGELTIPQAERQTKANEDGEARVKEMTDPAAVKEKTEAGHARDRWFAGVLKEEIAKDDDWKIVVEGQLDDAAYLRLATQLRWLLGEEVG